MRRPTEAEWAYAARSISGRRYPWGEAPPDAQRANDDEAGDQATLQAPLRKA